jgi:hypothetical protein
VFVVGAVGEVVGVEIDELLRGIGSGKLIAGEALADVVEVEETVGSWGLSLEFGEANLAAA